MSFSFVDKPLSVIRDLVDTQAAAGTDLIVLPETWRGQKDSPETLDGPTVNAMSAIAAKYHTYIVCPIDRKDGEKRWNSAVLIDRQGKVVFVYDKVYPYWSEYDLKQPVDVGGKAPVYQADFGRIGLAICFDVNFPDVWQRLSDQGAEIVVWPSAYSAGRSLQAHAINHHYYIVTSTGTKDCIVYDITGQEILYQKSDDINVSRVTLDLDRAIYHQNFNIAKRDKLLQEHAGDVEQEQWLDREQWFVLKAKRKESVLANWRNNTGWKNCARISTAAAAKSTKCAEPGLPRRSPKRRRNEPGANPDPTGPGNFHSGRPLRARRSGRHW